MLELLPSYGQMTSTTSGFSFDQFSNRSGNRAYLKNIGSDWPSLVHPKPITILEGCRLQLARPGVRPPSLPTRGESDRPRVCACKVGGSGDVSSKEKNLPHLCPALFHSFPPGWTFSGCPLHTLCLALYVLRLFLMPKPASLIIIAPL